jgi:hypothetical protein
MKVIHRTFFPCDAVPEGGPFALSSRKVRSPPTRPTVEQAGVKGREKVKAGKFHNEKVFSLCLQFVLTLSSLPYWLQTRMVIGFVWFVLTVAVIFQISSR